MNRRRHHRPDSLARDSLEFSLASWQRLQGAWSSIVQVAVAVENWERLALAEAKLSECESEIERLEERLRAGGAGP